MINKYHIDYAFVSNPIKFEDISLIQIGRLYCMPNASIDKHVHGDLFEITVVTDGKGTVVTNDVVSEVKKHDIYFSFPGDFHEIHSSEEEPLKYDYFSFNTVNEKLKKELNNIANNTYSYFNRIFYDTDIENAVSNAIAEYQSEDILKSELLYIYFKEIIIYIIRNFEKTAKNKTQKHFNSSEELCFKIMHYIDTNIFEIKTLRYISEKFKYNYSYLSNLFKQTTGYTIEDYYRTRRLETARLLLINEKKYTASNVSEMLHYSSLYSFSKAFKLKYGVSPTKYIKEQNKKNQ